MPVKCVDKKVKEATCKHFSADALGSVQTSGWCAAKKIGGGKRARVRANRKRRCEFYAPRG